MKSVIVVLIQIALMGTALGVENEKSTLKLSINKDSIKMRDPFKRKMIRLGKKQRRKAGKFLRDNAYSNVPTLEGAPLETIRITGVLLGKERKAIARIVANGKLTRDTFIVSEGMKLGENDAEIKAILPGGIVLVEKIRNVYDQDEYIETIIPISSDLDEE